MRINKEAVLHKLPTLSDRATQRVRGNQVYVPRIKQVNEVAPPASNLWQRDIYRVGDGEQVQSLRSGSQDASKIQSKGFST